MPTLLNVFLLSYQCSIKERIIQKAIYIELQQNLSQDRLTALAINNISTFRAKALLMPTLSATHTDNVLKFIFYIEVRY